MIARSICPWRRMCEEGCFTMEVYSLFMKRYIFSTVVPCCKKDGCSQTIHKCKLLYKCGLLYQLFLPCFNSIFDCLHPFHDGPWSAGTEDVCLDDSLSGSLAAGLGEGCLHPGGACHIRHPSLYHCRLLHSHSQVSLSPQDKCTSRAQCEYW